MAAVQQVRRYGAGRRRAAGEGEYLWGGCRRGEGGRRVDQLVGGQQVGAGAGGAYWGGGRKVRVCAMWGGCRSDQAEARWRGEGKASLGQCGMAVSAVERWEGRQDGCVCRWSGARGAQVQADARLCWASWRWPISASARLPLIPIAIPSTTTTTTANVTTHGWRCLTCVQENDRLRQRVLLPLNPTPFASPSIPHPPTPTTLLAACARVRAGERPPATARRRPDHQQGRPQPHGHGAVGDALRCDVPWCTHAVLCCGGALRCRSL